MFSDVKMKECDQKILHNFDQVGITIPDSAKYILRVANRVSLKLVTIVSLREKKFFFTLLRYLSKVTEEHVKKLKFLW